MKSSIDTLAEQVMERCDLVAQCTDDADRITRLFLTPAMQSAHRRVAGWMREADLDVRIDSASNCIGRRQQQGASRSLLIGSHLDSVPGAGRYDGVLGVLLGLAVCQCLADEQLPFHLDVVGFSEEEGVRYKMPYLGSAAVAGRFDTSWLDRKDDSGLTMHEAMIRFGLDPAAIPTCAYQRDEVVGFIEPHLEQGPILEQLGLPVGVVTGIAGQSRLRLAFDGRAGHAGTTPMAGRRDALVAASEFVGRVRTECLALPGVRATVGSMTITPNASNVIPSRVELTLDVRHLNNEVRKLAISNLLAKGRRAAMSGDCEFAVLEETSQNSVRAHAAMAAALRETVAASGLHPMELESGAGHDAVIMGQSFPMAMLFLRHPGGVSHHPDEAVLVEDVAVAIDVLGRYVQRLAADYQ